MGRRKEPYRSKVKIGVDAEGRDINKWFRGYTRAEFEANRERIVDYYIAGDGLEEDRVFGAYASEWFHLRKEPFVSASSRESYRTALNKDILPAFGDRKLRAITAMELQEFLNRFADMSSTKITVVLATLRGIFGSAQADRIIRTNPAEHLRRPKAAAPREKVALTADQRAALERTCREQPGGQYLALLYYLGVRPGEARGLRWEDIDWEAGRVSVLRDIDYKDHGRAGELKTRKSRRVLPLPAPLRAILQPLRGLPACYIASGESPDRPLAKTSGERLWVELMVSAGLACQLTDAEKKRRRYQSGDVRNNWQALITPHALRHNFITLCWEHGLDPYTTMKLAGHTSIKTTMDIYTHLSDAQLSRTAAQVDGLFAAPATFRQPKTRDKRRQ